MMGARLYGKPRVLKPHFSSDFQQMKESHRVRFQLAIPADKFLNFYRGRASSVIVKAEDGRRIEFPANSVRRFLDNQGIYGQFEIRFDKNNRLIDIERIE